MNLKALSLKQLLICLLFLIPFSVSAQKTKPTHVDSLLKQLTVARQDTTRVNLLNKLGSAYAKEKKNDSSMYFLQLGLQLTQKIKWQKGLSRNYYYTGAYYFHLSKPDYVRAQYYLEQATELSFKIKDYNFAYASVGYLAGAIYPQKKTLGSVNCLLSAARRFQTANQIGPLINSYMLLGDYWYGDFNYSTAVEYYDKALKLQGTTTRNYVRAYDLSSIASFYLDLHQTQKAKMTYLKVIGIAEHTGNTEDLAGGYIGLAHCAEAEHDDAGTTGNYTKALQTVRNSNNDNAICTTENEIGWHYFVKKDYYKAWLHASRAVACTKADSNILVYAIGTLGSIYREAPDSVIRKAGLKPGSQYEKSLSLLKLGVSYGTAHLSFYLVNDSWRELSLTYQKMNRYAEAFNAYKTYISHRDSTDSLKNEKAVLLKEAQLNYSQKEDSLRYTQNITNAQLKQKKLQSYFFIGGIAALLLLSLFIGLNYYNQRKLNQLLADANAQVTSANQELSEQREEITTQRDRLVETVSNLKTAQQQLVQAEKMASLGELTAGIAHEIQNPLNFVNNFAEVNREMLAELTEALQRGDIAEALAIAADVEQNEEKIHHHGKRADFIVKGMLEHSRTSGGERQITNINLLADEFFKLSYQGLRAKNKDFNSALITNFDPALPKVSVVQQDIGRVLINLFSNAFYAVNQKRKTAGEAYKPTVEVSTSTENGFIVIRVKDNGDGIPEAIKEKIMQPFFTTKPTGEGTGLGLSLSYDIIVKGHGGNITVSSKPGEGAEFVVQIPEG